MPIDKEFYRFSKTVAIDRALPINLKHRISDFLKEKRFRPTTPGVEEERAELWHIAARSPFEYSVIERVFREMRKLLPGWAPRTMLDVGSKVNMGLWAAREVWDTPLKSYMCVEDNYNFVGHSKQISYDMGVTVQRQLQLSEDRDAKRRAVAREPITAAQLTICAYHLRDVSKKKRRSFVTEMWKKTQHTLVLIERGDADGFEIIAEARDHILTTQANAATVVAPCGHDKPCPMRNNLSENITSCTFGHRVLRSGLPFRTPGKQNNTQSNGSKSQKDFIVEKFSYCVIRRKGAFETVPPEHTLPVEDVTEVEEEQVVELTAEQQREQQLLLDEEKKEEEELERLTAIELEKLKNMSQEELRELGNFQRPKFTPTVSNDDQEGVDQEEDWLSSDGEEEVMVPEDYEGALDHSDIEELEREEALLRSLAEGGQAEIADDSKAKEKVDWSGHTPAGHFVPREDWYSRRYNRVMQPPNKKPKLVVLDLCNTDGELERRTISKSQQLYGYRHARKVHQN